MYDQQDALASVMRALLFEDGDTTASMSRFVRLIMLGSLRGLDLRADDRSQAIAEMARRAAVVGGGLGPDEPMPEPIVFDYPESDFVCGVAMARRQCMAFCHDEDDQWGVVVLTDGKTAACARFSVPRPRPPRPSDAPGMGSVY